MNPRLALQYLLPHRLLSTVVRAAAHWRWRPWKNFLIRRIIRRYAVELADALEPDPGAYEHFNAFFTRALKPGARPVTQEVRAIACPADGRVSQAGRIRDGRIFQAKGKSFSCAELLGSEAAAAPYRDGSFLTIYLSPRDYHRVHMPLDGTLQRTTHVPGRLFTVAPFAVRAIPRLFARNERLVCHFSGPQGPFVVVMVGALLVSGVETVWNGVVIPPYGRGIVERNHVGERVSLRRGDEMTRFNMGSTVIVLVPAPDAFDPELEPGRSVRMGSRAGELGTPPTS